MKKPRLIALLLAASAFLVGCVHPDDLNDGAAAQPTAAPLSTSHS